MQFSGKKLGFSVLFGLIILAACSKKGGGEPEEKGNVADRQAMLINIADNIVIPAYANFKTKLDLMVSKSNSFSSNPSKTTLTDFRAAWVNAYIEWQKVALFEFGPGDRYVIHSYFNVYPASEANINSNIASGTANFDLPSNYTAQGFPALDYLINGLGTDDEIVLKYTSAADAQKRIAYLNKITSQMNTVFTQVYSEWKSTHRDIFVSKTSTDASSSTSTMVNGIIHNYERSIRSGKFGIPSGVMQNGTLSPEKVEAFYKKDISLTLAKTAQQAAVDFFNGKHTSSATEGPSLKTYLNALSATDSKTQGSLTKATVDQFQATSAKINLITNENLNNVTLTNNQLMKDVYTEMQKSVRMLKVDMTSAMSITITYTDNDGD